MKRTDVTYGQLDQALRSFGFASRPSTYNPPGVVYEHRETGAIIMLPKFPDRDKVHVHHLMAVRMELENFGFAVPAILTTVAQKAG